MSVMHGLGPGLGLVSLTHALSTTYPRPPASPPVPQTPPPPGARSSLTFRVYGRTVIDRCGALAASAFLRSSLFAPALHS